MKGLGVSVVLGFALILLLSLAPRAEAEGADVEQLIGIQTPVWTTPLPSSVCPDSLPNCHYA
ncbi:MAG: hypothetical protein RRC07_11085, partial [Anaerolineae bacterium]|nr:hypothetical protein [Anaerolineae bacterium]